MKARKIVSMIGLLFIGLVGVLLLQTISAASSNTNTVRNSPLPSPRATVYGFIALPLAPTGSDPNSTPSQTRRISLTPSSPLPTPTLIPDFIPPQTELQITGEKGPDDWYRSPVSVSFVITDNFFAGVTEYQLDQAMDWSYREYHYPPVAIEDEGIHTLAYRSIDIVRNIESPQSAQIRIDRTAPQAAGAVVEGNQLPNGWYNTPVTVTLHGSDALAGLAGFEAATASADWATMLATTTLAATSQQTLTWRAVDNAGNVSAVQQITLLIDMTPPTTTHTLDALPVNGWYTRPVTVTLSALDAGAGLFQTQYRAPGSTGWQIYGGPFGVNGAGVQTVQYQSSDRALNLEPAHTFTLSIDLAAPTLTLTVQPTPVAGIWSRTGLTITAQAVDDDSGVAALAYTVDNAAWQPYRTPLAIAPGTAHTVRFRAVDHAGHVVTDQLTLGVDGQPPTTTLALSHVPNAAGWFNQPLTLTLVATDTETGVFQTQYQWQDQASPAIYQTPLRLTAEGRHTLTWFSLDRALNQERPQTHTLQLDLAAPLITYTISGGAVVPGWYQTAATVAVTATDALAGVVQVEYALDDAPWQAYSPPLVVAGGGQHRVALRARDRATNLSSTTTAHFGVDTLAPISTARLAGGQAPNGWYVTPVTVTLTTTDTGTGVATLHWRLNGGLWYPYTAPVVVTAERVNLLEYYAVDKAGNQEIPQYRAFSLDLADPTARVAVVQGIRGTNDWYIAPITLTLAGQDLESGLTTLEYALDDEPWHTYTTPVTVLREGVYRLLYRAADASGRVAATHTLTVSLDFTPPVITHTLPFTVTYGDLALTHFYTATDGVSGVLTTTLLLNDQPYQPGQMLTMGPNVVELRAVNRTGLAANLAQRIFVTGGRLYLPVMRQRE